MHKVCKVMRFSADLPTPLIGYAHTRGAPLGQIQRRFPDETTIRPVKKRYNCQDPIIRGIPLVVNY